MTRSEIHKPGVLSIATAAACALFLASQSGPAGAAVIVDQFFDQYEFFGNSAPPVSDSEWGRYAVTVTGGGSIEFLNVVGSDSSGIEHWLVRNLPILPEMSGTTITTAFDLTPFTGGRGFDAGSMDIGTTISTVAATATPTVSFSTVTVGDVRFDAEGKDIGGQHSDPGTPADQSFLTFDLGGLVHVRYNTGQSNVEQGIDECGPGAAANSLEWLKNTQGLKLPDTVDDRLDTLADADHMNTNPPPDGSGTTDENFIRGKLKYVNENNLHLQVKFMDDRLGGKNIDHAGETALARGTTPTSKFIFDELNADEDVEIGFTFDIIPAEPFTDTNGNGVHDAGEAFTDQNGNGTYDGERDDGGHWVQAVGKIELFGFRGVWFVEDTLQGVDNDEPFVDANNNGKYDPGETFTDQNGDGVWNDSGTSAVGFSWLGTRSDGLLELVNYGSRHKIDIVVSESIPEPGTLVLFCLGLGAVVLIGRLRRKLV